MSTGRWERSRCRIRRFSALYTWRASDVGCIPDTASSYNKNGKSTPFFSCFTISDTCTTAQITLWDMPFEPEKYVDHAVAVFRNCTVSDYKKDTNGMSLNTRRLDVGKKNTDKYPEAKALRKKIEKMKEE